MGPARGPESIKMLIGLLKMTLSVDETFGDIPSARETDFGSQDPPLGGCGELSLGRFSVPNRPYIE